MLSVPKIRVASNVIQIKVITRLEIQNLKLNHLQISKYVKLLLINFLLLFVVLDVILANLMYKIFRNVNTANKITFTILLTYNVNVITF